MIYEKKWEEPSKTSEILRGQIWREAQLLCELRESPQTPEVVHDIKLLEEDLFSPMVQQIMNGERLSYTETHSKTCHI